MQATEGEENSLCGGQGRVAAAWSARGAGKGESGQWARAAHRGLVGHCEEAALLPRVFAE